MDLFKYIYLGSKSILIGTIKFIWFFIYGIYTVITIFPKYFILGIISIFSKNKKASKKVFQNKKVSLAMLGLSVAVYLICIFFISRWWVQGLKIKYLTSSIITATEIIEKEEQEENQISEPTEEPQEDPEANQQSEQQENSKPVYYPNDYWDYMNVPFIDVNFDELLAKNSDTVGWIKVDGTKVNYPIVQYSDNDYYLHHAFNKSSNSSGWIFADYRVNLSDFGKNTIIYGHNMNNNTMFGTIPWMLRKNYYNNSSNYYIKISTPTSNTVWKVFSVYMTGPEVFYLRTNFKTYSFEEFVNDLKTRSTYDFGIDITADDKILTLSTCDNTGTKRIVAHAKMISIEYK